jgi:predicted DNA-binding antitoxin AbrB/MazE fold protein
MTIDVDAVYEDGVLKPERPLQLEEKAKVHVIIEVKAAPRVADDDPTAGRPSMLSVAS